MELCRNLWLETGISQSTVLLFSGNIVLKAMYVLTASYIRYGLFNQMDYINEPDLASITICEHFKLQNCKYFNSNAFLKR